VELKMYEHPSFDMLEFRIEDILMSSGEGGETDPSETEETGGDYNINEGGTI